VRLLDLLFREKEPEDIHTYTLHCSSACARVRLAADSAARFKHHRTDSSVEDLPHQGRTGLSVQLDHNNAETSYSEGEVITKGRSNMV
jgi:DUF971 family protein